MRPTVSVTLAAVSWLWLAPWARARARAQESPPPELRAMTAVGCFSSSETLEDQGYHGFQTSGYCQKICVEKRKPVLAMSDGTNCWCGDLVPAAENKVDDSECDFPCNGFPEHNCGGDGKWTVMLSGLKPKVSNASPTGVSSTSDAASSTRTAEPQVVTVSADVQTVTASTAEPNALTSSAAPKSSGSSGASKAGIAAGAVVGVLGLCALAGGIFIFVRMRRRRAVEEEYRRNAEINKFIGKEGSTSSSTADSRLEPSVMMQRRMSDGSIADNQDYSRRILKVTNPDGT